MSQFSMKTQLDTIDCICCNSNQGLWLNNMKLTITHHISNQLLNRFKFHEATVGVLPQNSITFKSSNQNQIKWLNHELDFKIEDIIS